MTNQKRLLLQQARDQINQRYPGLVDRAQHIIIKHLGHGLPDNAFIIYMRFGAHDKDAKAQALNASCHFAYSTEPYHFTDNRNRTWIIGDRNNEKASYMLDDCIWVFWIRTSDL